LYFWPHISRFRGGGAVARWRGGGEIRDEIIQRDTADTELDIDIWIWLLAL